jgi:hypothetical protein
VCVDDFVKSINFFSSIKEKTKLFGFKCLLQGFILFQIKFFSDPDLAPSKAIQNVVAHDAAQWQPVSQQKFDTTYRTEFINRARHPVCINKNSLFFTRTKDNFIYKKRYNNICLGICPMVPANSCGNY